jgi:hypothetical protein
MAIYHCEVTVHKKSAGHSALGATAYRAGIQIDEHDFRNKDEVASTRTFLSKSELHLSETERIEVFRDFEKINKRKNAQLGIEAEFSLPVEFTKAQNMALMEEICIAYSEKFPQQLIDCGFHDKPNNPHLHLWRSDRLIDKNYEWGNKYRSPDNAQEMMWCRKIVADITNKHLERNGFDSRITHLSLKDQGIDREPTKHEGRKGQHSLNKRFNVRIHQEQEANIELGKIAQELKDIQRQIKDLETELILIPPEPKDVKIEQSAPSHRSTQPTAEEKANLLAHLRAAPKTTEELQASMNKIGMPSIPFFKSKPEPELEDAPDFVTRSTTNAINAGMIKPDAKELLPDEILALARINAAMQNIGADTTPPSTTTQQIPTNQQPKKISGWGDFLR